MTSADKKAAEEKAEVAKLQASQLRFSDAHIWLSVSAALYNLFVDNNSAVGIYISTAYFAADVALFSKLFHPSDFFHHALGLLSGYIAIEYDEKKLYCLNQLCEISTYFLNQYHRDKSLRSSQYFAASFFLVRVVFPTVYTLPWYPHCVSFAPYLISHSIDRNG